MKIRCVREGGVAPLLGVLVAWLGSQPCGIAASNQFEETDLVSDIPGRASHLDPNLVNPWGISFGAKSPFWVSDNGTGLTTLYNGDGDIIPLVVTIPTSAGGTPPSAPTGQVNYGGTGFEVSPGAPSHFIFASEDGTISGWNSSTTATRKVDNSPSGAIYKGLAIGNNGSGDFLYAANFHGGTIDVFDSHFAAATLSGSFTDPTLPSGYAPFNIQNIGGKLYVTYALQDAGGEDDVSGAGHGYVNVFDLNGSLLMRLASGGPLNSPWGLVLGPEGFGPFEDDLLVGNFGDGRINAFDPTTGNFLGYLKNGAGNPLEIEGLWALTAGNGGQGGDEDDLYFTAGIAGSGAIEDHGLFGEIAVIVPEAGNGGPLVAGIVLAGFVVVGWRRRRA